MIKITPCALIKRRDNIPYKETEREGTLLNLHTGDYFTVNEMGLFVWKLLDGTKNLEQVADSILSRYNTEKDTIFSDLTKFINALYHGDLVTMDKEGKR